MPTVAQQPSDVDILGVAGAPFTLSAEIAAQDPDGNPLDWSIFSDFAVILKGVVAGLLQAGPAAAIPTITTPSSGQVLLSWTAEQTSLLGEVGDVSWALQTDVSSEGPYPLVAGSLAMGDPTTPGASTSASIDLTVNIGAGIQVTVTVALGGGDGGGGGGSVDSVNAVEPDGSGNVELTAADVGADASGAAAGVQSNLNAEATTRSTADTVLAAAISAETTRAEAAEATKASTTALTAETTRAEAAEGANATAISAETTRAEGAESTNATAIAAETTRAEGVEATKASTTALTAETTRAEAAESTNATTIAAETARAEAAEALAVLKANNLSDVADKGSTRYNIHDPALTPVAACSNSVGNVSITSAPATLDGVTLNNGDLILLCVQATQSQNGLWTFNGAGSALTRPTEFPSAGVVKGRTVMVEGGSYYNVATAWALVTPTAGITIDTSSQMWVPTATPYGLPVLNVASPQFNAARVDSSVSATQGSSTVTDASIGAGDGGLLITHPAFPYMATYVGTVTAGVSFVAVNSSGTPIEASQTTSGYMGVGVGGVYRYGQADMCINNAIASLPASGGIVYIPNFNGPISTNLLTVRNTIKIGNGYNNGVKLNGISGGSGAASSKNGATNWGGTRTDTGCSVSGSTINDASITTLDQGCPVTVGAKSGYVTSIVANTSFVLSTAPVGGTAVTGATGTTAVIACTFFGTQSSPLTSNPNPQQNSFPQQLGNFGTLLTGLPDGSFCTYSYADSTGFYGVQFVNGTSSNGQPSNTLNIVAACSTPSTQNGVQLIGASTSQPNYTQSPAAGGPQLNWAGGNVLGPIIDVLGPVGGVQIKNLTLSGNGSMTTNAGGGIGLRLTASVGGLIEDVTVLECPFAGVQTRAWPVSAFASSGANWCNNYKRLQIAIMGNVNGAYGIDINGTVPAYPTGSFDSDTCTDDFELMLEQTGPGTGNTNTMIHFGNADVNRVKIRNYDGVGGNGTTNLIMFDYNNSAGLCASNLIDLNGFLSSFSASPNLIVNNGTPSTVAAYRPNRIVGIGTEGQGAPLSLANCLFGWQASQNPTFAAQTFTSGTGAQCTATSISVDNEAYITVTAGGTLTVAISEPWGNAAYTTILNAITVVTGQVLTVRVPAGCFMKITAVTATYTTMLQALV